MLRRMSGRIGHPGWRQQQVEASFDEEQILGDYGIAAELVTLSLDPPIGNG